MGLVAYLDCFCGVSGDMLLGALVDAGVPAEHIADSVRLVVPSGWRMEAQKVTKRELSATSVTVHVTAPQPERGLGDILTLIGKSTLSAYLARHTAKRLIDGARAESECVVYVTFEQAVEEIESLFQAGQEYTVSDLAWGRADIEKVRSGAVHRLHLPIWLMGESILRRKRTPRMTVENVYRALSTIEDDYNIRPILIVMDYAQIIPIERNADRVERVGEAIVRSKELARYVGCPIVMCVQASRRVDHYDIQIPTASDCQWASQIEQAADKLLGIWRPCLTESDGQMIDYAPGKTAQVNQRLMIAKLLKQRMEAAGHIFALHFAPEYVRLADLELEHGR